ncbi:MAG: PEP-utilizing enzyme [Rhodopila sp.]|jgi:pyruvate,orthophosphate dikinase
MHRSAAPHNRRISHAAVVARQLGKVCLVACPGLEIDLARHQYRIGGSLRNEDDLMSLDGNTGAVYAGKLMPVIERPGQTLAAIAGWWRAAAASAYSSFRFPRTSNAPLDSGV